MSKINSQDYTEQFFKSNKEHHLNYEKAADPYLVSSGSLTLDEKTGGGFGAGVHKFVGATEGGKTSEALLIMRNMFLTVKKSKGIYIKAEGRLGPKMRARSGLTFVDDPADWVDGTCLVFDCNIYDVVFDYLRGLLRNNPDRTQFCIVIDSMDGLVPKGDLDRSTGDAHKVAAGAVMSSDFLSRVSSAMNKFGHMCIMLSQVRAKPKVNQYEKRDPNDKTNSSGGNAQMHYPDWILEFLPPLKSDMILEKPDAPLDSSNTLYGHLARVKICKSDNETTGFMVKYPIKRGRVGGNAVWTEKEVYDMLMSWGFVERRGTWFYLDEEVVKQVGLPEKLQGKTAYFDFLESEEGKDKLPAAIEFVKKNCFDEVL